MFHRNLRIIRWTVLLAVLFSTLIGGVMAVTRAANTGYGCLRFYYNTNQHWLLDTNSGAYLQDRRVTGSPLDARRGAYSAINQRTAYVSKVGSPTARTFQILIEAEADGRSPAFCPDLNGCWRTLPTAPDARKIADLNTLNVGLAWSPDGSRLGYVALSEKGELVGVVVSPEGSPLHTWHFSGTYANVVVHGWTGDGKYLIFSTIQPPRSQTVFWEPGQRVFRVPLYNIPYASVHPAPAGNYVALLPNDANWLAIVEPDQAGERGFALSNVPEMWIKWSPTGEALATQSYDPPYWRVDVYLPNGGVYRDIGGVFPADNAMTREGSRELFWSADGRSLTFLRRRDDGLNDLLAFNPYSGVLAIPERGLQAAAALAGRDSLLLVEGQGEAMRFLTVRTDGTDRRVLAENLPYIGNVQVTPDGAGAFFTTTDPVTRHLTAMYISAADGTLRTLKSDLQTLKLVGMGKGGPYFWFWWKDAAGQAGAEGFTYDGLPSFHYALAAPYTNLPITYQSPGGQRALALWSDPDSATDYLQFVGDGLPKTPVYAGGRLSVMASWSPDSGQAAILSSQIGNNGAAARQTLTIYNARGELLRQFSGTAYGPLAGWSDCRGGLGAF